MRKKSVLIIFSAIFALAVSELLVVKLSPQLTYNRVYEYSFRCYLKDLSIPFTLGKNQRCSMREWQKKEYDTFATINKFGYRGAEFDFEKKSDLSRILIVGDSMTFGIGVSDFETYPYKVEEILKDKGKSNIQVINAGYTAGFSPDSYYVYLKERGMKLEPDILILAFFVWNDISDLSETVWEEVDDLGLPIKIGSCCRMIDSGILRNKITEFKYKYPLLRNSHLFILFSDLLNNLFHLFSKPDYLVPKRDLYQGCIFNPVCLENFIEEEEKTYKVLKAIQKLAQENEVSFFTIILPVDIQLDPNAGLKYGTVSYPMPNEADFIQKRISSFLSQEGIDYLDLYPIIDKQRDRGYPFFEYDGHLNPLGNQIVAEAIVDYMFEKEIINYGF